MNEILFYSGIAAAAVAIAGGVVIFLLNRAHRRRLERTLDAEYGERKEQAGNDKRSA